MQHPIGTTQHLHGAIERMHKARHAIHDEAADRVAEHPISQPPEDLEETDA